MPGVSDFLQREYARHPGSISIEYAGEIGLNCLNESATATGINICMTREFVQRYNSEVKGMASLSPPDATILWKYLREDIEQKKVPLQKGVVDFDVVGTLKALDGTPEGIRYEYDLFPGYAEVHRPTVILSVMQNIDCIDFENS